MEKRPALDGSYPGFNMLSARDSGSGIPDPGKFNKRGSHYRVPQHDRRSRDSRDRFSRNGSGSTTAGLPNWYHYTVIAAFIVIAIIAAISLA